MIDCTNGIKIFLTTYINYLFMKIKFAWPKKIFTHPKTDNLLGNHQMLKPML